MRGAGQRRSLRAARWWSAGRGPFFRAVEATAHGRYSSKCRTRAAWSKRSDEAGVDSTFLNPAVASRRSDPRSVIRVVSRRLMIKPTAAATHSASATTSPSLSQISALNPPMIAM